MAELFQSSKQNISHHIRSIFEEGELNPEATVKKYLTVRQEGKRQVQGELEYYNLDMIISVGYRVNSVRATQFRQWATQVLREFAKAHAESEFEKYRIVQDRLFESDFDRIVKQIESAREEKPEEE